MLQGVKGEKGQVAESGPSTTKHRVTPTSCCNPKPLESMPRIDAEGNFLRAGRFKSPHTLKCFILPHEISKEILLHFCLPRPRFMGPRSSGHRHGAPPASRLGNNCEAEHLQQQVRRRVIICIRCQAYGYPSRRATGVSDSSIARRSVSLGWQSLADL